jgi:cyanosortase A-associated protein
VLLAGVLGSTVWVLGRAIAVPKSEAILEPTNPLSATISLRGWELQNSSLLSQDADLPPGRQYQYRQQATRLDVQARLMISDGNISRLLFVHTPIKSANAGLQMRHRTGVGYYAVLAHQDRLYLSACVNSRGESTVTEPQFMQNRYKYDLQVGRVLPWILGQEPLLDQRCLWTLMSTPLPANTKTDRVAAEKALKTLENAWYSWHREWELNFPAL